MRVPPLSTEPLSRMFEPFPQIVHFRVPSIPPFNFDAKEWLSLMVVYTFLISVFVPAFLTLNKHLFKVFTRVVYLAIPYHFFAQVLLPVLLALFLVALTIFFLWMQDIVRGYVSTILTHAKVLFEKILVKLLKRTLYADTDVVIDVDITRSSIFDLAVTYTYCIWRFPLIHIFPEQVTNWLMLHRFTQSCPSAAKSPALVILLGSTLAAFGAYAKVRTYISMDTRSITTLADFVVGVWLNVYTNLCSIVSLTMVSVSIATNAVSGRHESLVGPRLKAIAFVAFSDALIWTVRDRTSAWVRFSVLGILSAVVAVSWTWFMLTLMRMSGIHRATEEGVTWVEIASR